jgi:hypothetical protein
MAGAIASGLALLTLGAGMALKSLRKKNDEATLQQFFEKGVGLSYPVLRTSTSLDVESVVETPSKKRNKKPDSLEKAAFFGTTNNLGAALSSITYKVSVPFAFMATGLALMDYADRVRKNNKFRKYNKRLADEIDKNLQIGWELVRYKKQLERGELDEETSENETQADESAKKS